MMGEGRRRERSNGGSGEEVLNDNGVIILPLFQIQIVAVHP